MAAKSKKLYVVLKGHKPGIYDNWDDAKKQVDNFQGAQYKGFENHEEAHKAWATQKLPAPEKKASPTDTRKNIINGTLKGFNPDSISVDAACSGNPGKMEYRGVDNMSGAEIFRIGPMWGNNNMGEFLALVHAIAHLKSFSSKRMIYSDSRTAISWVKAKNVRSNLPRTAETASVWGLVDRAIIWLTNNPYSNPIKQWDTELWGENPADFGRK
jgi:ribonuclease HI